MSIFDAAMKYAETKTTLVILAGHEYGTGSSRDWAAKGTRLLGVKAVVAASFERIHRSNLVGMGVLPLQFSDGTTAQSLGLDGSEIFSITGLSETIKPSQTVMLGNKFGMRTGGNRLRFAGCTHLKKLPLLSASPAVFDA